MKSTSMRQVQEEETSWRLGVEQNQNIKTTFLYFVTFTRNKLNLNIHCHRDTQKGTGDLTKFYNFLF